MTLINKIWVGIVAVLGFAVMLLRGRLKDAKIKELGRNVSEEKAARASSDAATEELLEGLKDESKPVSSRTHFGDR